MIKMKEIAQDVGEIRRNFYESKGRNAVKQLQKNRFDAEFVPTAAEAVQRILALIPDGSSVGVGNSQTIYALDLDDALEAKNCTVIPSVAALNAHSYESDAPEYDKADSREAARRRLAQYLTSDVFLLGAGAITMKGEIVNVDGRGNRIAGSSYGADRIIVVAGANKIVPDEDAARERIRFISAPMDNIKYGNDSPCVRTGICADCASPRRICNITSILHKRPVESDFHVILIGEALGF